MSRVAFAVYNIVGISVAEALLPTREAGSSDLLLVGVGSFTVFGCLGYFMSRRLLDVGWPRKLAVLAVAPALLTGMLNIPRIAATGGAKTILFATFTIVAALATIVYVGLTVALTVKGTRLVNRSNERAERG